MFALIPSYTNAKSNAPDLWYQLNPNKCNFFNGQIKLDLNLKISK